jgi:hypothetical protein
MLNAPCSVSRSHKFDPLPIFVHARHSTLNAILFVVVRGWVVRELVGIVQHRNRGDDVLWLWKMPASQRLLAAWADRAGEDVVDVEIG